MTTARLPRRTVLAALAGAAASGAIRAQAAEAAGDLLIRNARIVDGSGAAPYSADLLIRGDRIADIGAAAAAIKASRVIDARGRVVAPGFIDAHSHGEALDPNQVFENFLAMGVTTIILGQDGTSPDGAAVDGGYHRPTLTDWYAHLEQNPPPLNIAALVGFGSVRTEAGVPYDRPATPAQIIRIHDLIDRAMGEGVFGASLGMEYVPMISATAEELKAVAQAVGKHDGVVMSHLRSEDDDKVAAALDELLAMGPYARVHLSHAKVVYGKTAPQADALLAQLAAARAKGIQATADAYPYLASQSGLALLFPDWAKVRADFEKARRERRPELERYLHDRVMKRGGPGATLLASPPYTGVTLEDLAAKLNKPFVDVLIDVLGPNGSADYFVMDAAVQDRLIMSPEVMISTDGSPTMHHPRAFGTHARLIETYVRKQGLALPLAIRKMAAMAAAVLKLPDRGLIREGYKADLVVFDPAQVHETATWTEPMRLATGFDVVIVNGQVVRENGVMTKGRFGRVLRKSPA